MERAEARATGLALAIWYCTNMRVELRVILHLADRFTEYIQTGVWPREAVSQYGEGQEREVPDAPVDDEAGEAGVR
jgi:hypothetical protein